MGSCAFSSTFTRWDHHLRPCPARQSKRCHHSSYLGVGIPYPPSVSHPKLSQKLTGIEEGQRTSRQGASRLSMAAFTTPCVRFSTKARVPISCSTPRKAYRKRQIARAVAGAEEKAELPVLEQPAIGLMRDVKRRLLPHLASDLTDGMNAKTMASAGFLFCACLSVAVAFGAGVAVVTQGQMGCIEMVLSTAACGVVYALTCGQPLAISGFGGAHLAFTGLLYSLSEAVGVEFLPAYAWVGIWSSFFLFVMTLTSVSNLVLYFTRFTDETFSALSSVIFIYESTKTIAKEFVKPGADPTTAYLSALLAALTFITIRTFAGIRKSIFFRKKARELVADFAPTIGIAVGALAASKAVIAFGTTLPGLALPVGLHTSTGRPWLVDIFSAPVWVRWAAVLPAIMFSLLLFMDQVITTRLVNTPDNKLRKGWGYHLDLLVISAYTLFASFFGLPFMTAATVPSLNHTRSLAFVDYKGDVAGVIENRMSNFLIHLGIGFSVLFLRPLLVSIPLAVFMGLFLYLGVSAALNNKFLNRATLLLADPDRLKKFRPKKYVRNLPLSVTIKYTLVQLTCLASLWLVKSLPNVGIMFPVLVAGLVPCRLIAGRFFDNEHLQVLDDCGDALEAGRKAFVNEVGGIQSGVATEEMVILEAPDDYEEE